MILPYNLIISIRKLYSFCGVITIICDNTEIANVGGDVYSVVESVTHAHACIIELLSVWLAHLPVPGKIIDVKKPK